MMRFLVLSLLFVVFISCEDKKQQDWRVAANNPAHIHHTVKKITDVIVHDIFSPPVAARIYTYMSVAGYEASVPSNSAYRSLAGQLTGFPEVPKPDSGVEYCYPLASVQAMLNVGTTLVFSEDKVKPYADSVIAVFRDSGMPQDVFERSIAYGNKVSAHVMSWAGKDNYKQTRSFPKYSIENDPATWKPTPPAYMDAVEPHWNKIRPFAIDSAAQFAPQRPTAFSKDKTSQFYKEAMEVYQTTKNLTEEQKSIAFFWDCNPFMMNVKGHVMFATKKISPGGHWMNITHSACRKVNADVLQSLEAYALVAVSLVDGFISCWDEKYRSRLIRPESFINQYIDEDWLPLLQTPPFPEYTSGHSVISAASAVTLTKLFGDNFAFTDSTEIEFGLPPRSFTSFMQAADEAAISRMYGGIHYRPGCEVGKAQGKALAQFILEKVRTKSEETLASQSN